MLLNLSNSLSLISGAELIFLPDGFSFPVLLYVSASEGFIEMRCSFGVFSSFTALVWFAS